MAVSMKVYLAPDSDLRAFAGAPKTLQMWLRTRPQPPLSLGQSWRALDAIIGSMPGATTLTPLTSRGADYQYPKAADHGAHGLSSPSAERLLGAVAQVDRDAIERWIRARAAETTPEPDNPPMTPELVAGGTEELLQQLVPLRGLCELAVTKRYGLVMALWEEP